MKIKSLSFLLFCTVLSQTPRTWAHGANISFQSTQAIEIQARYDGGTPMADAQVTVYAPDNPATPWLTGITDEEGKFMFTPDTSLTGNWDIKVRQAGHGDLISIPLGTNGEESAVAPVSGNASYTPLQKALMAAVGVWGFVGTALFFSRRKPTQPASSISSESQVKG
jgi:nickel transport protein